MSSPYHNNLRSGVLFSEERESTATRDSVGGKGRKGKKKDRSLYQAFFFLPKKNWAVANRGSASVFLSQCVSALVTIQFLPYKN